MCATRRTWREVTRRKVASSRKRWRQILSQTFTRQRASRNSSGCWMRRLRRDVTTPRRKRKRRGHSTEGLPHPTHQHPHPPLTSHQLRPSQCVCVVRACEVNQYFTSRGRTCAGDGKSEYLNFKGPRWDKRTSFFCPQPKAAALSALMGERTERMGDKHYQMWRPTQVKKNFGTSRRTLLLDKPDGKSL